MCRHSQSWAARRDDEGVVAVEFALVLPLMLMLLMGLVTTGLTYSRGIALANAVREGSRFGATAAAPAATPINWTPWVTDVITRTRSLQADDAAASSTICVKLVKNASVTAAVPTTLVAGTCDLGAVAAGPAPTPPSVPGNTCFVMVWGTRSYRINALTANFTGTMERHSLAQYERTC